MPLVLDEARRGELLSALLGAYPENRSLANAVWVRTGLRLEDEISLNGGKRPVFTEAIKLAEGQGWLEGLVRAGLAGAPLAEPLKRVAAALDLVPLSPPPQAPPALASPHDGALEELIRKRRPPVLMQLFAERLQAISRAVCWIGVADAGQENPQWGSGFLVAPDLLLTNHHVAQPLLEQKAEPGAVSCRFDHLRAEAGGAAVGLAAEWCLDASPPAPSDTTAGARAPTADELDYALLRLARPVGQEEVAGAGRGWLRLAAEPPPLLSEDFIFVVQHPAEMMDLEEGAQRIALGTVLGFEADGLRVRYDAGTTPGSSGSPGFTSDLQCAALHHGAEPLRDAAGQHVATKRSFNRGIPLRPILRRMQLKGVPAFWG